MLYDAEIDINSLISLLYNKKSEYLSKSHSETDKDAILLYIDLESKMSDLIEELEENSILLKEDINNIMVEVCKNVKNGKFENFTQSNFPRKIGKNCCVCVIFKKYNNNNNKFIIYYYKYFSHLTC